MKITAVNGIITSHGQSTTPAEKDGEIDEKTPTTYQYITFRDQETGETVEVGKIDVRGVLNRHVHPDVGGTFVVAKGWGSRRLIGYKSGKEESVDPWVFKPKGIYAAPITFIAVGIVFTLTIILAILGIPTIIFGIYLAVTLPRMPEEMKSGLRENGFQVQQAKSI